MRFNAVVQSILESHEQPWEYKHKASRKKPKLLYHTTFGEEAARNIQQKGLIPKLQMPQNFKGVFMTRTKKKAKAIGYSMKRRRNLINIPMFIATIDASKISNLYYDGMYLSGLYTTEPIPAEAIVDMIQI